MISKNLHFMMYVFTFHSVFIWQKFYCIMDHFMLIWCISIVMSRFSLSLDIRHTGLWDDWMVDRMLKPKNNQPWHTPVRSWNFAIIFLFCLRCSNFHYPQSTTPWKELEPAYLSHDPMPEIRKSCCVSVVLILC